MDFGNFSAMHDAGTALGKTFALYGAGFSVGRNIIQVFRGKVRGPVGIAHVMRDTAIFFGVGYLGGALGGGVLDLATRATGTAVPTLNGATNTVSNSEVVTAATDLSTAAGNLIEKVTRGAFDMLASVGQSVGTTATMATQDTAIGNVVATVVGIFGAAGSATGSAVTAAISAVTLGTIAGLIFGLIFDK